MESQNYLGIYLSKDAATVVCLGLQGRDYKVLDCFSVSVEQQAEQNFHVLTGLITRGCAERELKFSEVAVALDCAMFMQHNVSSEFDNPKQIAATIRFDTEDVLATDITDIAIAFKIVSTDQAGSKLAVFTAQRKILSDILLSLQSNNIDPSTIEPDVNCLSRFICRNVSLPQDSHSLLCVLSGSNGYFIDFEKSQKTSVVRTSLLGQTQHRGELLAREVPLIAALARTDEPINCLKVFDSTNSVDPQQLGEKLGIESARVDLAQLCSIGPELLSDTDPVGVAIAYGAALTHLEKAQSVNFRNDFMPYQGKKVRLQKTLKFASYSLTVFVLAVGLYFQLQLFQENKYRSRMQKKLIQEYSVVMFGKKPPAKSNPVKKLAGELRRIQNVKKGQLDITGGEVASAKLTLVLEAFNKCAPQTNLNIDSIAITTKTISITGDTSSRKNTLKLFKAIKPRLQILQQRLDSKAGRDKFHITVVPKK